MKLKNLYLMFRKANRRISYRRVILDMLLSKFCAHLEGVVLDLGGKKAAKRGYFRPPNGTGTRWFYANIERATQPDLLVDGEHLPIESGSVDAVVCTEVLEHLASPRAALSESFRILKQGGSLYASIPFLYPVHADPSDFQRWTAMGLNRLFNDCGFSKVIVVSMGGSLGTIGLLVELAGEFSAKHVPFRRGLVWSTWLVGRILQSVSLVFDTSAESEESARSCPLTSGYFVVACK